MLAGFIIWLIVFAVICFRRREWGVYLIIFFLPFYLLRLKVFGVPTTVLELEIYILSAIWLIRNLNLKILPPKRDSARGGEISKLRFRVKDFLIPLISVGLLFFGAILSTIFSSDLRISIGILKGWFFDPLLFSIVLIATMKSKKQIENVLTALSISGVFVAITALFYYFFGHLTFDGRLRAFFLSPNHLAMYLAPSFLIACYFSMGKARNLSKVTKSFLFLSLVLIGGTIYLTYSYGAWFGIFASLFFGILVCLSGKARIFGFLGILLLIFGLVYPQFDSLKLQNLIESSRSSFQSRLMVWQSAFKIAKDHLFLGIGPGMFQKYYLDYQKHFPPYLEWAVPQPHNLFLAFLLQTGPLGLLGFVGVLIWFFGRGAKLLRGKERFFAAILMGLMVYILNHGLVDTTYWKNDLSLVFWLVVFLMFILLRIEKGNQVD